MPIHRPARSTLALLTAAVVLPLSAAQAATSATTPSATQTTTAQPTSVTTTTESMSTQTATSESTSSSSTTSQPSSTTTTTTTQTSSSHGHDGWTAAPRHRHRHPTGRDLVMRVSPKAHAASDPTDTISDFKFAPATITIHVGDTITWVNNGPAPHTATANNGSFDTGNLNKGQSASHTFTQAGTFAYICKIHPFMHGTVVVLAAASSTQTPSSSGSTGSSNSSGSTGASSTTPTTAAATTTASGLPNTGMNLLGAVGAGLLLAAGGIALRRRLSRSN